MGRSLILRTSSRKRSRKREPRPQPRAQNPPALDLSYVEFQRQTRRAYLLRQLHACRGNVSQTARLVKRNRSELFRTLKNLGISPAEVRATYFPSIAVRRSETLQESNRILRQWIGTPPRRLERHP